MGVVNVTPNSFSDGGQFEAADVAEVKQLAEWLASAVKSAAAAYVASQKRLAEMS